MRAITKDTVAASLVSSIGSIRRKLAVLLPVAVLVITYAAGAVRAGDCPMSPEGCIQITHAQLLCIAKRLNRLLARQTDPVYFDAAQCGEQNFTTMAGVPLGMPIPPPATIPTANWLQLTKAQLKCLGGRIIDLQSKQEDPILVELRSLTCP